MSGPSGPQTKTIEGLAITAVSLEPADAYDLLPELAPVLGAVFRLRDSVKAPMKAALEAIARGEGDIEIEFSGETIADALRIAGQALGGGKLTEVLVRLLRTTTIAAPGGEKYRITDRATFSLAFAGRMWAAVPVAAFAFEVTYGNFSDVVALLPGAKRPPAAAP